MTETNKEDMKEQLLFLFNKLLEKNKLTKEEYTKAIKIVLGQYT